MHTHPFIHISIQCMLYPQGTLYIICIDICIDIFFPVEDNGYFPKILKGFSGLKK